MSEVSEISREQAGTCGTRAVEPPTSAPLAQVEVLPRYSGAVRATHWLFAALFLALLATGLALELPELRGIEWLGLKLLRELHLTLAILLLTVPATAAAWDSFRAVGRLVRSALRFDADDRAWLAAVLLRPIRRGAALPPQGFLNAGQKLNLLLTLGLTLGLALTGLVIAPPRGVPQDLRETLYGVHQTLAYLTVPLVAAHVFLAALNPATRESLRGMTLGYVRRDWAEAHHAKWARERSEEAWKRS